MENNELLSESVRNQIEHWCAKFPAEQRRSALLPALTIVQKANKGYLTKELIAEVANVLGIDEIAAFEVATFYSMYELEPVGKHKLEVCTNISCMLRGSDDIVKHIGNRLGIGVNETTKDGKFTLRCVECLGACVNAPMMQVGDHYHENLDAQKVDRLLDALSNDKVPSDV